MITHDLMEEFEALDRGTPFLEEGDLSGTWWQHTGRTVATNQQKDSPHGGVQDGKINYAAALPNDRGYHRIVTRDSFGPNIDVFGWFRAFHWYGDATDNHGVKLYTGFEDNNCNNTISLLRKGRPTAWYVEDRLGVYPERERHSGDNQTVGTEIDPTEDIRHRFLWRQRIEDEGLRGALYIDGALQFDFLSNDPLYRGHVGWRLDRVGVDWSISVREV